ncbi:MAG: DUF4124 domain-containing protein [Gammaproteobacteria bacterium]|jgi:hypothetical protein
MTHSGKQVFLRNMLPAVGLLGAALALLPFQAGGEIYKWTDEAGEVHYSQTPPPAGVTTERIEGAPPPAEDPEKILQHLEERLEEYDDRRAMEDEDYALQKKRRETLEIVRENCKTARRNLAALQQGGEKRYLLPNGEVRYLTEEDRAKRIEEAESQIKEYCEE